MPAYYNPYMNAYPMNYGSIYNPMQNIQQPMYQMSQAQQPQYMINVDGENSAKSWQPQVAPQPNTIIPLFDSDGQHVYFKTYDNYGRMNPIRKGRIVFDDEINASEMSQAPVGIDTASFATKEDLNNMKEEVMNSLRDQINRLDNYMAKNNQNGNNNRSERR